MTETTGRFWCNHCREFFPDALEESHLSMHDEAYDRTDRSIAVAVFWVACVAVGALAGVIADRLT